MMIQTQVHELGFADCPKSFVFRGTKEYSAKQIQEMLGLTNNPARPAGQPNRPGQPPQMTMAANRYDKKRKKKNIYINVFIYISIYLPLPLDFYFLSRIVNLY